MWVLFVCFYCFLSSKDEDVLSAALLLWTQFVVFLLVAYPFELLCWFNIMQKPSLREVLDVPGFFQLDILCH